MTVRVQVLLSDEDKERFAREARRAGVSLSAWLRQAGIDRLRGEGRKRRFSSKELGGFLAACRAREVGGEPDWEQHRRLIESSKGSGAADS
jgi:hypothetical protein